MAIRTRSLLRKWFGRGQYPTSEQFSDFFDSFVHRSEDKIALDKVDELPDRLNGKYGQEDGARLEGQVNQLSDTLSGHIVIYDDHFSRLDAGLTAETTRAERAETAIREELTADDAATLQAGKTYTDGKVTDEATLREQGDAAALQSANEHTDSLMASERTARESGDRATLQFAKDYVNTAIAELVDGSPAALDTLQELSTALGDDPNFAATVAEQIGQKVDKVNGKGLSTEDYTTAEKSKLAGMSAGANNYVHPTAHSASIITQDAFHRFVTDAEKSAWNGKASTAVATALANGLMSVADKKKLDKLQKPLTIQLNGASQPVYDGSMARTINITPESIEAQTAAGFPRHASRSMVLGWNMGRAAKLFVPGYEPKAFPSGGLSATVEINIGYPVFVLELASNISTSASNLVIECSHNTGPGSGARVFDYRQRINHCGVALFTKKASGVALQITGFMFYPTPGSTYVISVE